VIKSSLIEYFCSSLAITNKEWAAAALRHLRSLNFQSGAGQFVLKHSGKDKSNALVSLSPLKRVSTFTMSWETMCEHLDKIEKILVDQEDRLRQIEVESSGENRIRSAPELNRLIRSIGGKLTCLSLDGINLVKCSDSLDLISSTCTGLRSLNLRGANLPPKSSHLLTRLGALECLLWDFGNASLAAKMKSVASDMAMIKKLTKLQSLVLTGASGFNEYFPEAKQYLNTLYQEPEAIRNLLRAVKNSVPPLVGSGRLALGIGNTIFSGLISARAPEPILMACLEEGAQLDSVVLCPGVQTVSPLMASLNPSGFRIPEFPEPPRTDFSGLSLLKFLLHQGASVEYLYGEHLQSYQTDRNKALGLPPAASSMSIFEYFSRHNVGPAYRMCVFNRP
jgi:hypothetical protein